MARTTVLPSDPIKRKAWATKVIDDSSNELYFARMIGPEDSASAIVKKIDVQKGSGDEIVTTLSAQFRGPPVIEGQKLEGKEFRLQHAAHTMRINEYRHGVNLGARIEQARVGHSLPAVGRRRLTDYIKSVTEETIACAMSGARGTGNEIKNLALDYVGYPNALRAPDAAHLFTGSLNDKTKATLVATDVLKLQTINRLRTKAKKMLGGQPENAVKMDPVEVGGKKGFILAACPESMGDLREDVGAQGWIEAQRALTTAIGRDSELFKGGAGWFNGILIDEMDTCVKFSDYGAGTLPAARALLMGAGAGFVAHGTKGMTDGLEVSLGESTADNDHDKILHFEMIFGADKTAFNSMDLALISVDLAFTAAV